MLSTHQPLILGKKLEWLGYCILQTPNWTTDNDGVPYVITVNVTKPSTITCVEGSLEGQKLTAGTQVEFQTTVPEGRSRCCSY